MLREGGSGAGPVGTAQQGWCMGLRAGAVMGERELPASARTPGEGAWVGHVPPIFVHGAEVNAGCPLRAQSSPPCPPGIYYPNQCCDVKQY